MYFFFKYSMLIFRGRICGTSRSDEKRRCKKVIVAAKTRVWHGVGASRLRSLPFDPFLVSDRAIGAKSAHPVNVYGWLVRRGDGAFISRSETRSPQSGDRPGILRETFPTEPVPAKYKLQAPLVLLLFSTRRHVRCGRNRFVRSLPRSAHWM